jgi:hypothetical protein
MIGNYGTMVSTCVLALLDNQNSFTTGRQHQRFRKIREQDSERLRADRDRPSIVSLPVYFYKLNADVSIIQLRTHGFHRRHHRRRCVRFVR